MAAMSNSMRMADNSVLSKRRLRAPGVLSFKLRYRLMLAGCDRSIDIDSRAGSGSIVAGYDSSGASATGIGWISPAFLASTGVGSMGSTDAGCRGAEWFFATSGLVERWMRRLSG
jgi:hypothetical protein